jgi:hypothetical protein
MHQVDLLRPRRRSRTRGWLRGLATLAAVLFLPLFLLLAVGPLVFFMLPVALISIPFILLSAPLSCIKSPLQR